MGSWEDLGKALIAQNQAAQQLIAADDPYLKFKQAPDLIGGLTLQAAGSGKYKMKDLIAAALASGLTSGIAEGFSDDYQGRALDAAGNVLTGRITERPDVLSPGLFKKLDNQRSLFSIQSAFANKQRAQDLQDAIIQAGGKKAAELGAEDAFWNQQNVTNLPQSAPTVEGAAEGGEVKPGAAALLIQPDASQLLTMNPKNPRYQQLKDVVERSDKLSKEQTDRDMQKADDLLGLSARIAGTPEARNLSDVASNWQAMVKLAPERNQSAAVGMITAAAKILDPGAVVREQDFTIIADPGSPARSLQSALDKLKGQGQLTKGMKEELLKLGRAHVESRYNQYSGLFDDQTSTAGGLGLDISKLKKRPMPSVEFPSIPDDLINVDQNAIAAELARRGALR